MKLPATRADIEEFLNGLLFTEVKLFHKGCGGSIVYEPGSPNDPSNDLLVCYGPLNVYHGSWPIAWWSESASDEIVGQHFEVEKAYLEPVYVMEEVSEGKTRYTRTRPATPEETARYYRRK